MIRSKPERLGEAHSFARGLNFYKLVWIVLIGSVLGVILEELWCLVTQFRFQSRNGLIYGPFNLVYGFGALIMTLGMYWLRNKRDLWIFVGGFVLGSAFEYLCSYVQEMVFGTVSWEYSDMPFNLNGRITLLYSFFWGVLGLLWIKDFYPRMSRWIERIPRSWGVPLTWALIVFMLFNTAISALAVNRQTQRHEGHPPANQFEVFLDGHYTDELLSWVYPNMTYVEDGS